MSGNDNFWDFSLGPVFGKAGEVKTLTFNPQCRYRVENVFANDTGNPPGSITRIMSFLVGNRLQRPTATGSASCVFFTPGTAQIRGKGSNPNEGLIRWDTCERGLTIAVTVSFVQAGTFEACVFGRSVV